MTNEFVSQKRIVINTSMLYFRMLLIMAISLYTSRIILQVLGVVDYGIYNVVGGVVTMLGFLNSSLSTATQRYLNYEMGKGNLSGLQKVFSMSFLGFVLIALVALCLAESIGLWFVYHKLIIPIERFRTAVWVYHFSVLTFMVNLLVVPYNAAIIAHEKMSVYAYVSIGEVVLKLLLVFLLQIIVYEKLLLYAIMMFVTACIVAFSYRFYCIRVFSECRLCWCWDKELLKGIFSFSGWMLTGTISNLFSTQGVNILMNMFFGPIVNAARAIAVQVHTAVNSFVANFMTAVRPQIVKSYSQGKIEYMYHLVFSASKFSFFLLFILVIPILFNTELILRLWLKTVPDYAVLFTRLLLIDLLINATYNPIAYVSQASGKIRDYQLVISIGFLLIIILTWLAFFYEYPVYFAFVIAIGIDMLGLFSRLWVLKKIVDFPVRRYLKLVCVPTLLVLSVSIVCAYLPYIWFEITDLLSLLFYVFWCIGLTTIFIWHLGLNAQEKRIIFQTIKH